MEQTVKDYPACPQAGADFSQMLESSRRRGKLSKLSAMVIDATDTEHWDVFKYAQKTALHLGAVTVASLLAAAGFGDVKAVYEVLTPKFDYSKVNPDLIGVSAIIANIPFANRKIKTLRESKPDALIIAGGAGYFFDPEPAMEAGADAVVIGKAEYPVMHMLERVSERMRDGESLRHAFMRTDLRGIKGVYKGDGPYEPADMVMKMDEVPDADFSLIVGKTSRQIRTIMSSEGCTVQDCDFCSAKLLNNRKYRHNGADAVVRKLKKAQDDGVGHGFIADDHFLGRGYHNLVEITDAIMKARLNISWSAQLTVKSVYDKLKEGIVDMLVKSKCSGLYFGVESIYDDDLAQMNASKKTSYEMLKTVLDELKGKITVHAMCVLKPFVKPENLATLEYSVDDTPEGRKEYKKRVLAMVDFLKSHDVRSAQFHSAVPIPGAGMTPKMFNAGIVLKEVGGVPVDWSKYTGQYVIASSNPLASHNIMVEAYERFYSLAGIAGSALSLRFSKAFIRYLGKFIVISHKMLPETRRYVKALKQGDFEFYKPGEMPRLYLPAV